MSNGIDHTLDLLEESMHDKELMSGDTGALVVELLEKSPAMHDPKLFALIKKIDKDRGLSAELNTLGIRQLLYSKMSFSPQLHQTLDTLCRTLSGKLQEHRREWPRLTAEERIAKVNHDVIDTLSHRIDPNCLDENLVTDNAFVVLEDEETYPGFEGFADPDTGQIHVLKPDDDPELLQFEKTHNLIVHEFTHSANAVLGQKRRLYGWTDDAKMTELDYQMNEHFWQENLDTDETYKGKYINPVEAVARAKEAQWSLATDPFEYVAKNRPGLNYT